MALEQQDVLPTQLVETIEATGLEDRIEEIQKRIIDSFSDTIDLLAERPSLEVRSMTKGWLRRTTILSESINPSLFIENREAIAGFVGNIVTLAYTEGYLAALDQYETDEVEQEPPILQEPELELANARRTVEVLTAALDEDKVAFHLLPTDDFGGAIKYLDPQEIETHSKEAEASGRQWEILSRTFTQLTLEAAQAMVDYRTQKEENGSTI